MIRDQSKVQQMGWNSNHCLITLLGAINHGLSMCYQQCFIFCFHVFSRNTISACFNQSEASLPHNWPMRGWVLTSCQAFLRCCLRLALQMDRWSPTLKPTKHYKLYFTTSSIQQEENVKRVVCGCLRWWIYITRLRMINSKILFSRRCNLRYSNLGSLVTNLSSHSQRRRLSVLYSNANVNPSFV